MEVNSLAMSYVDGSRYRCYFKLHILSFKLLVHYITKNVVPHFSLRLRANVSYYSTERY